MTPSTYVWTSEAIEAHAKSVEHWERLASGKRKPGESIGPDYCALCALFWKPAARHVNCDGCPVKETTGRGGCLKTPYGEAEKAEEHAGLDSPEFRLAAQAELEFLRSLRPKE